MQRVTFRGGGEGGVCYGIFACVFCGGSRVVVFGRRGCPSRLIVFGGWLVVFLVFSFFLSFGFVGGYSVFVFVIVDCLARRWFVKNERDMCQGFSF